MGVSKVSRISRWSAVFALAGVALLHGTQYDLLCDDALIALRYAQNLIEHHQLAYNLGERVEGFTSPLWVLLCALSGALGVPLTSAARGLGAFAGLGTFWSLTLVFDELSPKPWLVLLPAACLALSAPFAAWLLGGLETPLFAGLFTLTLATVARALRRRDTTTAWQVGAAAALATLCRPEAFLLLALSGLSICLPSQAETEQAGWRQRAAGWSVPVLLLVGGYELFRLAYYGSPLPNTFYVKAGSASWAHGWSYLAFAAREHGLLPIAVIALSAVFLLLPKRRAQALRAVASRRTFVVVALLALLLHTSFVARVGGDFLDLYRFLVPLLPLAFCLPAAAAGELWGALGPRARWLVPPTAAGFLASHAQSQVAMIREAMPTDSLSRLEHDLEPLGWTRDYARRWQGIGTWLSRIKQPTDSLAVGAAGAIPFYSGLPNLDLFGLSDREVARSGQRLGDRPGHQRFATMAYLFSKRPTFVLMSPELTPLEPAPLPFDPYWDEHGYVPIRIRVDRSLCGCGETFYHQFLVRRERAASLRGRSDAVVGD